MNEKELNKLVGLSEIEAVTIVEKNLLKARCVNFGMCVTMDYEAGRVTLWLDKEGNVGSASNG